MSDAQPPVFVDDTGRRRILTRRAGRVVVVGFTAYLGRVALGFARDPKIGPIQLPTFGLPSLGLMIPPAPTVLGEQATRTASEKQVDPGENGSGPDPGGGTTTPEASLPTGVSSPAAATAGRPAAPGRSTTSPTTGPPASTSSTSTTSSSTSATSSTTTSTTTMQGQGQGQGSETAATKGPDGGGPPGQLRKTTSTTAG